MTYFTNIHTLDELKREYRRLAFANHPDRGGDVETLKLERVPHWKGHIEYVITLTKTLSDGTKTQDLREVFPGKDRRKAFARAAELRRQRPGIPYEEDIARRPWE